MPEEPKKKFTSHRFQRFICLAYVLSEPTLKTMKGYPKKDAAPGTPVPDEPYCMVFAGTGAPYGSSGDTIVNIMLKGRQAELFCSEPRKGHEFLFDGQLKTYDYTEEGASKPTRKTIVVGRFEFCGPRQNPKNETTPAPAPKTQAQPDPALDKADPPF